MPLLKSRKQEVPLDKTACVILTEQEMGDISLGLMHLHSAFLDVAENASDDEYNSYCDVLNEIRSLQRRFRIIKSEVFG